MSANQLQKAVVERLSTDAGHSGDHRAGPDL
jgi:hypothetical protein